jgi:hypothetical protein
VGVYTKSKSSELSPLRRKLLRFAKQFPPPLRSNYKIVVISEIFLIILEIQNRKLGRRTIIKSMTR